MTIYRLEWAAKMALGWVCFWIFMALPGSMSVRYRPVMWVLQWAGFYANSYGFAHWLSYRKVAS